MSVERMIRAWRTPVARPRDRLLLLAIADAGRVPMSRLQELTVMTAEEVRDSAERLLLDGHIEYHAAGGYIMAGVEQ